MDRLASVGLLSTTIKSILVLGKFEASFAESSACTGHRKWSVLQASRIISLGSIRRLLTTKISEKPHKPGIFNSVQIVQTSYILRQSQLCYGLISLPSHVYCPLFDFSFVLRLLETRTLIVQPPCIKPSRISWRRPSSNISLLPSSLASRPWAWFWDTKP